MVLLGLLILCVPIGLAVWLLFFVLPPNIAATTFIGSATVLGSVGMTLYTTNRRHKAEIENDHRQQRADVYQHVIHFYISSVLMAEKMGQQQPGEQEMIKEVTAFSESLFLWGRPQVFHEWNRLRSAGDLSDRKLVLVAFEDFVFAIREDLGHSNEDLERGDILRTFITDFDVALADLPPRS